MGGASWAKTFNTGEIHIFTVTIAESSSINTTTTLCLTASTTEVSRYGSPIIVGETSTISVSPTEDGTKQLVLRVESNYGAVYLWQSAGEGNGWGKVKIASITREVVAASSVAAPTISPASGTYDGDLTVTITPGEGNDKVTYSVVGSNEDASHTNVDITSETVINLTGTGAITVTATGYKSGDASNAVTNTYTYDSNIPSGIIDLEISHNFPSNWDSGVTIDKSKFANIEEGDYIFLYGTHEDAVTDIGLRSDRGGYDEAPWYGFTNADGFTSGGNGAHGSMTADETYWWIKVGTKEGTIKANNTNGDHDTDIALDAPYYLKNYNTIIQGLSLNLTKVEIHKAMTLSANADNDITKRTDMIVNLDRSFTANTWNTVCLPFVPTSAQADELFGSGYQLAAYTSVSGTTMHFTPITLAGFEAGKPYLVMPKTGCATGTTVLFDVDITAKNPTPVTWGDYTFTGTFTTKKFTSADNTTSRFVATGNELVTPNENSTLKSLRCYFTVPAAATARSLTFDIDEEGGTTSINTVQGSGVMVNGYYNLNGQRVAQPTKGLYIVNGKKVVIK